MSGVDYTKFNTDSKAMEAQGALNRRWWLARKEDRAASVAAVVNQISDFNTRRYAQYQTSARLYGNASILGMNQVLGQRGISTPAVLKDKVSYNIVQSTVDTITSKMAKNKPKPLFLTSGGDYKLQRKAKKLDKFVEGIFYANDAYSLGNKVFRDSCILADGFIHVFDHYGRVQWDRTLAPEIYVDWMDGFYGKPRQMHLVKRVDREVLADLFSSKARMIREANSADTEAGGIFENISDQLTVVESWHLPSGPEATDGLHTINLAQGNLFEEEWTRQTFPFAKMTWSDRVNGYFGQSLAEQIQNIQLEVNKILWIISRSFHLAGTFKILMERGSRVVKEHINNDLGPIVEYTGTEPKYIVPPVVPVEYYSQLQNLKTSAYEQAGISQLSSSSQKPAGLNSGKALREFNDLETDRFQTVGQAYEKMYLDLSRESINTGRDIYSQTKKFSVAVPGKKFIETIDWKDIDLEDDEFFMKIFPVSSLPTDPAGRLQTIQEYIQAGFITPRTGRRLLDVPDLEQIEDLQNATEEYLHMILEKIVDEGKYTPPDPEDDLQLAAELALLYYAQGKCNGLEPEKLEMLRRFMIQVKALMAKAMTPPPGAAPPGGPGGPQAAPNPQPQSDLIQNVPGQQVA